MFKRTRGVGDFDTSDLRGGSRPTNDPYYRQTPTRAGVEHSTHRSLTGQHVETLRKGTVNGFMVTVNRYDKDDSRLQLIIDNVGADTTFETTVSMRELDKAIRTHTGGK